MLEGQSFLSQGESGGSIGVFPAGFPLTTDEGLGIEILQE
jgi:hypothetical protein